MAFDTQWSEQTRGYAVAFASCGAALVLRLVMLWLVNERGPFFPFVLAVLVTAWYGGLNPGLLATGLGAVLGSYLIVEPNASGNQLSASEWFAVGLFVIIGVVASLVCEALHAARRRIEEKRRKLLLAENALKEADRRKDEFLAVLAHELRNPLAPLSNAIEILRDPDSDERQLETLRALIQRQVQHMVRLVDDLLDVSRITTGKLNIRLKHIDLLQVIRTSVEFVHPLIDEMGEELILSLPSEPIIMEGDAVRLTQVFSNLLNNAAKYSEKGSQIRLTVNREGDAAVISVKDSGIGISQEDISQIFQAFSQVKSAVDRAQGGLGIGLSLVSKLVTLHGGSVQVLSGGRGLGSEFLVRLPICSSITAIPKPATEPATPAAVPVVPPAVPASPAERNGEKCRVVVVDDNRDAADTLALLLRMKGFELSLAYDGPDAMQVIARVQPHAVLLDIGLPTMSGYEVARHIREQPWGHAISLIALTGWGQEDDRRKATEAGFDHHLTKPADLVLLENLLRKIQPVAPVPQ